MTPGASSPTKLDAWLGRAWWLIMPPLALLVLRLTFERTCGDPYGLVPALTSRPLTAWPLAAIYVAGYGWTAAAYVRLVARTWDFWPLRGGIARGPGVRLLAAVFVLAIDSFPVSVWRLLRGFVCGG